MTTTAESLEKTASQTFVDMMEKLGFSIEVKDAKSERNLMLYVNTPDPGRLIGRKGKYLECAEHLLNSMMKRDGGDIPRVMINVDGYERGQQRAEEHDGRRERSTDTRGGQAAQAGDEDDIDEKLVKQARDIAKEVKRWGDPVTIGPFNARDRRGIHVTLKEEDGVRAESGEETQPGKKKITILPADASE